MGLRDLALRSAGVRARPPRATSVRPPAGALESPNFYGTPHQPLWPSFEGATQINLAGRNLYAARCLEKIADSISGLPYQGGNVKSRSARPTTRRMQLLGPAPGGPNPLWSSARLWRYSLIQYLAMGKMAWLNERDDAGRIRAYWPLMAQHLVPVLAAPGGEHYFESYRYGTRGAQGYREFPLDEVTYVYRPSQLDMRQPEAPLRLARQGIEVLRLIDEFDRAFLDNGGVPAHLVITPAFTGEDARKSRNSFRNQFGRKFGGARNAGKTAFAEFEDEPGDYGQGTPRQTVDVKVIGQSQKDSQMAETRLARIDDMCTALGVPLSLLGISRDSKYTNMTSDRENYWKETIKPFLVDIEDAVNTATVELDGPLDVGWFDTSGVPELRKPPVLDPAEGIAAVSNRLITVDEWRADRGLPPLPNGEGDKLIDPPAAPEPPAQIAANENDSPPAPSADQTPPKRAVAVRTDLLAVVREQLATELAAQRGELEARLAGKRGGRKRAHAQLDLGLAYDREHWQRRIATNLAPGLRAAGYGDVDVTTWSEDITAAVFAQLDGATALADDPFESGQYMGLLGQPAQLDAAAVQQALVQLAQGDSDAAMVLASFGGGAS
jgi:HK97 family phage portal protein